MRRVRYPDSEMREKHFKEEQREKKSHKEFYLFLKQALSLKIDWREEKKEMAFK